MNDYGTVSTKLYFAYQMFYKHLSICCMPRARDTKIDGLKEGLSGYIGPVNLYYNSHFR